MVIGKDQKVFEFMDSHFKRDPYDPLPIGIKKFTLLSMRYRSLAKMMGVPVRLSDWMAPVAKKELEKIEKRKQEKGLCPDK